MIGATDVDLAAGVLGQIVLDIVFDVLGGSEATEWYSGYRVDGQVVKQGNDDGISYVFEDFLGERRTGGVGIYLGGGVGDICFFFDAPLRLDQLGRQSVDPLPVVVVALQGVTISQICSLLDSYPTAAVSAESVPVLDVHDLLREVALVHVEVEAIHGNQLGEGDVVSLSFWVLESVTKHEHSFLGGMRVEVNVHLHVVVLLSVYRDSLFGCPDGWLLLPLWIDVEAI